MADTIVTIKANGRLMKPQVFRDGKLQDWTSSNTTIGSSNKKDRSFAHNYATEEELPTVVTRYDILDDWVKEKFGDYKRAFVYYCISSELEEAKEAAKAKGNKKSGSVIYCTDTATIYMYNEDDDSWTEQ